MTPDLDAARRFLEFVDPDAKRFTFQTFDDSAEKRRDLARVIHGKLEDVADQLIDLQQRGAGVFVTINETDGKGRKASNITRARAVFADLDGSPLDPVLACPLEPHAVIESSPGRFHAYWLAHRLHLESFGPVQKAIIARFGGDKAVHDLSRVMRLPGFIHQKGKQPFQTRIRRIKGRPAYEASELLNEFYTPPEPEEAEPTSKQHDRRPNGPDHTPLELDALRKALTGETPNAWHAAMLAMVAHLVSKSYEDWFILDWALKYRWPSYSEQQTRADIQMMIDGAHAKGFAPKNGATDWPEPIDIIGAPELVGWPELTPDCLPAPLYRYVMAEAERLNTDPCSLAVHALAACSSVCSDAWRVKPKRHDGWTQQPRVWSCVIKDVGARGTDMLRAAFWPVRLREKEFLKNWQRQMAEWEERQNERKKGDKTPDPKPAGRRITTQDATIEAATDILSKGDEFSKITIRCDELVGWLGSFNRYSTKGSSARAMWLEGYDGGPQHIDRIIRGNVYVPNWSVIVAGNIQPRRLAAMAKDLVDDGLFQRFLTIHTRPATLGGDDDQPLDPEIGREYCDLFRALAELWPPSRAEGDLATCWFDDHAKDVRRAFMPLIERLQADPSLPTIIRETAPKWSGLLARITLIYHLINLADRVRSRDTHISARELCEVTAPTVLAAATFLRRIALPNLFRLGFETMPEEGAPTEHARWLAGYLLAHMAETITAREIGRAYRPLRGKPVETERAMAVLCDASWATPAEGRHDGARWAINPAVHSQFAKAASLEKDRRERVQQIIRQQVTDL